jgi:uncharacterized protein (TIGR03083 family)
MLPDPTRSMVCYGDLRIRLSALLRDVGSAEADSQVVPACPAWTVTDTVAHLCGVTIDILDGNVADAGTTAWADRHVERFSPLGLPALLDRWADAGPSVEGLGPAYPPAIAAQLVFDATTHEHDIRAALGRPGARDADGVVVGLAFLAQRLDQTVRLRGLPTLSLTAPGWSAVAGDGAPEVEVEASTFELLRAFGGRRSAGQIRALAWSGDADPYFAVFDQGPLRMQVEPLLE